jgi:hypothetical protein
MDEGRAKAGYDPGPDLGGAGKFLLTHVLREDVQFTTETTAHKDIATLGAVAEDASEFPGGREDGGGRNNFRVVVWPTIYHSHGGGVEEGGVTAGAAGAAGA